MIRLLAIFTSSVLMGLVISSDLGSYILKGFLLITLVGVALFWYYQKELRD